MTGAEPQGVELSCAADHSGDAQRNEACASTTESLLGQHMSSLAVERRRPQQVGRVHDAGKTTGHAAQADRLSHAAFDRRERLWFWRSVLENAAASEVAVNVVLPCCVCGRLPGGAWRPPSGAVLGSLVLVQNLLGCFLEGFCKSTKQFSQTLRRTSSSHQLVFVSSQGFADGFLNVITSFPDIASSGGAIVVGTKSFLPGVLYCLVHMLAGMVLYHGGRSCGRRCSQERWTFVARAFQLWPMVARGLVLAAFLSMLFVGSATSRIRNPLPLDLEQPGLQGVGGARIVYDEFSFELPPLALGLAVGIFMSASGAALASLFCYSLFEERERPAARLIANFAATALCLWAQRDELSRDPGSSSGFAAASSFVLLKFCTSFCGALSAFAGTIGDVTECYQGSCQDANSQDSAFPKRRAWLPKLSATQNFLAHFAFILLIMQFGTSSRKGTQQAWLTPPSGERMRHWVREREHTPWQLQGSTEV